MTTWIRRRLDADDGVSLVEMLVAVFIIGVVLTALAGTLITSLSSVRSNESRTRATALANEVLENMRVVPWSQLGFYDDDGDLPAQYVSLGATRPSPTRAPLPLERSAATFRDGTQYEVRRGITWFDDPATSSPLDYKQLRAEISWNDGTVARELALDALRAPTPHEQGASEFTLSLVDAQPAIVYLDAAGQVQAPPSGTYAATPVTLSATTNRPPDDFVYVTYLDKPSLALSGGDGRTWTRVESGQTWPNGDVEFRFSATRGADTVTGSKLVRFVRPLSVDRFALGPSATCIDDSDGDSDGDPTYPPILVDLQIQGTVAEDEVTVTWAGRSEKATFVGTTADTGASNWTFTIPAGSYDHTLTSVAVHVTRVLDLATVEPVQHPFTVHVAEEGWECSD